MYINGQALPANIFLYVTCDVFGHSFTYKNILLGGASIDVHGVPLTEEAVSDAKSSDAVLMGSIGGDAKTSPGISWNHPNDRRQDCWESERR